MLPSHSQVSSVRPTPWISPPNITTTCRTGSKTAAAPRRGRGAATGMALSQQRPPNVQVSANLVDALKADPEVKKQLHQVETLVTDGTLTPVAAARRLIATFVDGESSSKGGKSR